MSHQLHIRPGAGAADGDPLLVTPESAGWTYSGLRVVELAAGQSRRLSTAGEEVFVLPLAGSGAVRCEGFEAELAGRVNVFAGPSDFAYLPCATEAELASAAGGRFALGSARTEVRLEPAYVAAAAVGVEVRGTGPSTRQVNNFLAPGAFDGAAKVSAIEVITPAGNWSSYPPHRHERERDGEACLEEIYYYELAPELVGGEREMGPGFGFHRLYDPDRGLDLCEQVEHGSVVLVPYGYHGPAMTAPGYDMYYLCVLAGPGAERTLACSDDPRHPRVRESWLRQPPDPRVPLAG